MKILTHILVVIVIFLSAKPAIDAVSLWSEIAKSCASNAKCKPNAESQQSKNQKDQENNEMCNPFQSCVSCDLFFVSEPYFSVAKNKFIIKKYSEYQSLIASQFSSDFWQPPKFV